MLRIIAVGEGRGIDSLIVNGISLTSSPEAKEYIWYDTVQTFHSHTAGLVQIRAIDSSNRSTDTSVNVYKNRLPIVVTPPNPPDPLVAGATYRDSILAWDPDFDVITVQKVSGPSALTVSSNEYIQWTPSANDTGQRILTLSISDGYQSIAYNCTLNVVAPTTAQEQPVRFVTTLQPFPAYLEVDYVAPGDFTDSKRDGAAGFWRHNPRDQYGAVRSGNVVEWKPALTDTGSVGLIVTVSDAMKKADTLLPSILVVPPNRPFTVSMSQAAPVAADSSLDLSKAAGPDTLRFTINDPDNPLVEQHTMKIIQSHGDGKDA